MTLVFESIEDLQTRLVLLPRIEEEGIGAVVERCYGPPADATMTAPRGGDGSSSSRIDDDDIDDDTDDHLLIGAARGAVVESICIDHNNNDDDDGGIIRSLKDLEFAEILAVLRSANPPVRLILTRAKNERIEDDDDDDKEDEEESSSRATTTMDHGASDRRTPAEREASRPNLPTADHDDDDEGKERTVPQRDGHGRSSTGTRTESDPTFEEEKKVDPSDDDRTKMIPDHHDTKHEQPEGMTMPSSSAAVQSSPETTIPSSPSHDDDDDDDNNNNNNNTVTTTHTAVSVQNSIMSWASRFNVTNSVQMATERAQQVMEVAAEKRNSVAAAVMASSVSSPVPSTRTTTKTTTTPREKNHHPSVPNNLGVQLFVQTSSGAFLPIPKDKKQKPSSELRVTNSSVIAIRKSAAEACSPKSYSFQWYRTIERSSSSSSSSSSTNSKKDEEDEWVELPGATSRTFQPTATEVGHKIRCVVAKLDGDDSDDDDDDDDDDDENKHHEKPLSASLETLECVAAASTLFNGARQALVKGAQFGGIQGQGNAFGRKFHIKVSTLITKDPTTRKSTGTSALCFYQVSGSTSEPIHPVDEPILGVSAMSDHENAKGFTLILPDSLPESASMVKALATADGKLSFLASNRLGRESLLLSIGIANYAGEPSALNSASVLYLDDEQNAVVAGEDEEVSVVEEEPEASSNGASDNDKEAVGLLVNHRPPLIPPNTEPVQRRVSVDAAPPSPTNQEDAQRVKELERELNVLRSKLLKKDKAMVDLENRLKSSDETCYKLRNDLSKKETELKDTKRNLLVAERRMQSQEDDMKRMRSDQTKAIKSLNRELDSRAATISDLERTVRVLQNEKAVLSATVEARDSKLTKMAELQSTLDEMRSEASKADDLRNQLQQAHQKNDSLLEQLDKSVVREEEVRRELEDARKTALSLEVRARIESEKSDSCRAELDTLQMKIQKLKAERNNYKQKSDSLSKEMSRVCRQGRTIKDVEKIIADDAARRQEVELLRDQKRKALEDLNHYRTAFEQSRVAQRLAGLDSETTKMYERNAELERLLSELTEYVSAKEMQLETLKEINDALQEEITDLHRIQMSKNLGRNDV